MPGERETVCREMGQAGNQESRLEIEYQKEAERWGIQEIAVKGPEEGNPFTEHWIRGVFQGKNEKKEAEGFYDGEGIYRVRFMPSFEGEYTFRVEADFLEAPMEGAFRALPAAQGNHGPVRVADTWHFAYEDGTPYYSVGTTCYVWELQSDKRIEQTLASLKEARFNKIRFCIFPKHYDYNLGEPRSYPYEGTPMDSSVLTKENFGGFNGRSEGNHWDFTRFVPEHFQHIEKCIAALGRLGIEADLIMMHPYDRWGVSCMTREQDDLYWNYAVARFAAFHNVWWSLANEYDLLSEKTLEDWERYASILCRKDPYAHLRSVHNCMPFYDYSRPWVTHCSIQRQDLYKTAELVNEWRERWRKPVVLDEIAYEGNIQHAWGNITGEEMLRRFWEAACRGGYPGHGETYLSPDDVLWWSHGGVLHGESWKRFGFLLDIMKETPGLGLAPCEQDFGAVCAVPQAEPWPKVKSYYLIYYSFMRPSFKDFYFDDETSFEAEVIDTWEMTIEKKGVFRGRFRVELPGKQYMAIRLRRVEKERRIEP